VVYQNADATASVDGIDDTVDQDVSPLTIEQLRALGYQGGTTVDALTQLALNRARAANPAIAPDVNSANFQAYRQMITVWANTGQPNVLDPTPWQRGEYATATDAYVWLASGVILHATNKSGQWLVYLAGQDERGAIFKEAGWPAEAA
jgi:hypothetical protein